MQNLCFCGVKPMLLQAQSYAFIFLLFCFRRFIVFILQLYCVYFAVSLLLCYGLIAFVFGVCCFTSRFYSTANCLIKP